MRRTLVLLLLTATGCGIHIDFEGVTIQPHGQGEVPVVNVPRPLRQQNWTPQGQPGNGSCVHAAMISLFRWQGHLKLADWWRRHNAGGETPYSMPAKLDRAGVRYAMTCGDADIAFLEWAIKTHRGAGIAIANGHHMVALVHLTETHAGLLDSNDTQQILWVSRQTLIAEWLNSGSWAIIPCYSPSPPLPIP